MAPEIAGGLCGSWARARPGCQSPSLPEDARPPPRRHGGRSPPAPPPLQPCCSEGPAQGPLAHVPVHLSDKFPAAGCWAKGDMPLQFSKNYQIHPPISVNGSIRLPLVCNEKSFLLSFVLCRAGAGLGSWRPFSSERGLSMLSGPLTQEMPPLCFVSPPPTVWPERLDRGSRTQQLGRCLPGAGSAGQSQWSCEAPPPRSLPGLP